MRAKFYFFLNVQLPTHCAKKSKSDFILSNNRDHFTNETRNVLAKFHDLHAMRWLNFMMHDAQEI